MDKREQVIKALETCAQKRCEGCPLWHSSPNPEDDYGCHARDDYTGMVRVNRTVINCAVELLKAQTPREIVKGEWRTWKKAKNRDPLCYMWRGDDTPFWALKPEDINEPAYFAGQIVIFNGKPTKAQREAAKRDG